MFRTVPLSIIRSFHCTHSNGVFHTGSILILLASCQQIISLLCVQWKTPDDGQRNCPKHIEFRSKNKFEKLLYLFRFIIRNLSQRRSHKRRNRLTYFSSRNIFCSLVVLSILVGISADSEKSRWLVFRPIWRRRKHPHETSVYSF
jgi:hypothetical protein